jgi:hypothetical protein
LVRDSSHFFSGNTVDFTKSYVLYDTVEDRHIPNLFVSIISNQSKNDAVVGQLHVIRLKDSVQMPMNLHYIMLYKDYSEYNFGSESGKIRVYDLNYDQYMVLEADFSDGELINIDLREMPENISVRYGITRHHCDENGNGNVTFGECFHCLVSACMANTECRILCALTNFLGGGLCNWSFTISCIIISLIY